MIKGLVITPPVIGRISIGKVIDKGGKRLPHKDDEFTITTQVQNGEGWLAHPMDEQLRKAQTDKGGKAKLRSIPVRVIFNDPDLNLRADYCQFDRKSGRALCVGNGESCRRMTAQGIQTQACPSPDLCTANTDNTCKPYGRLNVVIGDEDELGSFVFRTTGYNSIRTLTARLTCFAAVSGGHLATMPLELKLRGKSTTQSHRTPIFYADLTIRCGLTLTEAIAQAREDAKARQDAGFDQQALDAAARLGLDNGMFEDSAEEGLGIVEEFYPQTQTDSAAQATSSPAYTLAAKLERKLMPKDAEMTS